MCGFVIYGWSSDPWNHVTCKPTKPCTECDKDNEIRLFDLILGTKRLMK